MSAAISATIDIDANPQAVWEVLTDFPSYGDWNPFMDRVEGAPKVGSKLVVHITPNGGRGMTFKPTVLAATPDQELRWLAKLGFGGLFDGEHSFVLTPNADGTTHLVQSERFSGVLVSLLRATLKNTHAGFGAFNHALKQRAETANLPR